MKNIVFLALVPAALLLGACDTAKAPQPPVAEFPTKVTDTPYSTTLLWNTDNHWMNGTLDGLVLQGDRVTLARNRTTGTLTSNVVTVRAYDQLIPSWNADTGSAGSLTVEVRHQKSNDTWTRWYTFGT